MSTKTLCRDTNPEFHQMFQTINSCVEDIPHRHSFINSVAAIGPHMVDGGRFNLFAHLKWNTAYLL